MIQKHAVENILWTKEERHQQVCVAALRHPQVLEIKVLFVEHLSGQTSQSASKQKVKSDQLSFSCFFRETTSPQIPTELDSLEKLCLLYRSASWDAQPAGTDHMTSGSWSKVLPVHEELWKLLESLMKNGIGGESVPLGHWCDVRVRRSRCDDLNPRTTEITHDHAKRKQGQRLPQGYRKETESLHHLCPKSVANKEFSSSVSRRNLSAVRLLSVRTWSARVFIVCSDVSFVREDALISARPC